MADILDRKVVDVALGLNRAELRAVNTVESSTRLVLTLIEARQRAGKRATYGAAAIGEAAAASHHFAQGVERLAACHSLMVEHGLKEGLITSYGDEDGSERIVAASLMSVTETATVSV